ncbi:hypothetical protein [Streptomyces qinzhouensis]|uniref:hypothetical protein n=1 Tax=Streptomyces qinzhouensis TaxID=2599401 RepID=UPI001647F289|nr:hypothetical protein [Streptomyces qinzhouensis]
MTVPPAESPVLPRRLVTHDPEPPDLIMLPLGLVPALRFLAVGPKQPAPPHKEQP